MFRFCLCTRLRAVISFFCRLAFGLLFHIAELAPWRMCCGVSIPQAGTDEILSSFLSSRVHTVTVAYLWDLAYG